MGQMNYVPKAEVGDLIARCGCELLHTVEDVDYCGGGIDNCVYLVRKPEQADGEHGDEDLSAM